MTTVIDDFKVPTPAVTILSGLAGPTYTEGAGILGGVRYSSLYVPINPYGVPANLDISEGFLKLSTGAGQFLSVPIIYGLSEGGRVRPLSSSGVGDFLSMGSAFRTNFIVGDGQDVHITYSIVVFTSSGRAQYDETVHPSPYFPTPIDFPFDSFNPADRDMPPDFAAVNYVLFQLQTWADFVIDSFEIV